MCVGSSTFSLSSRWNLVACGSTPTWPSIMQSEHVSRSRVARRPWACGRPPGSNVCCHTQPSADRHWPFSICSFLSFLSLKLFGETYFLTQPVTQAPTWTLVAIGEDWSRQELTGQGQGRIAPNGSGGSPMSDPACDPQPSDLLTGAWKPLDCTPANVNLHSST